MIKATFPFKRVAEMWAEVAAAAASVRAKMSSVAVVLGDWDEAKEDIDDEDDEDEDMLQFWIWFVCFWFGMLEKMNAEWDRKSVYVSTSLGLYLYHKDNNVVLC